MAWRFVLQPNGLLARFSDIVDSFTHLHMTPEEARELATEAVGKEVAEDKVRRALQDEIPWRRGALGDGTARWKHAIEQLERAHGKRALESFMREYEKEVGDGDA